MLCEAFLEVDLIIVAVKGCTVGCLEVNARLRARVAQSNDPDSYVAFTLGYLAVRFIERKSSLGILLRVRGEFGLEGFLLSSRFFHSGGYLRRREDRHQHYHRQQSRNKPYFLCSFHVFISL